MVQPCPPLIGPELLDEPEDDEVPDEVDDESDEVDPPEYA